MLGEQSIFIQNSALAALLGGGQGVGGAPSVFNMFEKDHKRVRFCHKKISRLMYGKNGLINFMYNLFAFFDP